MYLSCCELHRSLTCIPHGFLWSIQPATSISLLRLLEKFSLLPRHPPVLGPPHCNTSKVATVDLGAGAHDCHLQHCLLLFSGPLSVHLSDFFSRTAFSAIRFEAFWHLLSLLPSSLVPENVPVLLQMLICIQRHES